MAKVIWRASVLALFIGVFLAGADDWSKWSAGDASHSWRGDYARSSQSTSAFGPIAGKAAIAQAKTNPARRASLAILVAAILPEQFYHLELQRGTRRLTGSSDPSRVFAPRAPPLL